MCKWHCSSKQTQSNEVDQEMTRCLLIIKCVYRGNKYKSACVIKKKERYLQKGICIGGKKGYMLGLFKNARCCKDHDNSTPNQQNYGRQVQ